MGYDDELDKPIEFSCSYESIFRHRQPYTCLWPSEVRRIYVLYPEATWKIGSLPPGVYPLTPRKRTWKINKYTGIAARRKGYTLLPDFASTAHMIQGATLDAAFVDLLNAASKVSLPAQLAANVCLSRVKHLSSIVVMQPFSPLLFARGPPAGPDRLLRKLRGDISAVQAIEEWLQDEDDTIAQLPSQSDPMRRQHRCTSCYLRGDKPYMLDVKDFGIAYPSDFYSKYIAQGCWTRCLRCQSDARMKVATLNASLRTLHSTKPSVTVMYAASVPRYI